MVRRISKAAGDFASRYGRFIAGWVLICGGSLVGIASTLLIILIVIAWLLNPGVTTRHRELIEFPAPYAEKWGDEPPIRLRLQVTKLDDATAGVAGNAFLYTRNTEFMRYLSEKGRKARLQIFDTPPSTVGYALDAELDFQTEALMDAIKTETVPFEFVGVRYFSLFQLDDVQVWLGDYVTVNGERFGPVTVEVERIFAGRLLVADNKGGVPSFKLTIPDNEKLLVIGSSFIFAITCVLLVLAIAMRRIPLTTAEEAVTLAGFILAMASFRDFLGLDRLAVRSSLDFLLFLPALLLLPVLLALHFFRPKPNP